MKKSYCKSVNLVLTFLYVFCIASSFPESSYSINNFYIETSPIRISVKATYKFYFSIEKTVKVHDWIKLYWPIECTLPPLPQDENEKKKELNRILESISIGLSPCSSCQGLPIINYKENSITFNTHIELDPMREGYKDLIITVSEYAGIINPPNPGKYQCKIATQSEPTAVKSSFFDIVLPEDAPNIQVNPNIIITTVYEKEKTTISVQVSNKGKGQLVGSFRSDQNWIKIPQKNFENSKVVDVILDASRLKKGDYSGNIYVISNGGDTQIPVSLIVLEKDTTGPIITVSFPSPDYFTNIPYITIKGRVIDQESDIVSITINQQSISILENGFFEYKVNLLREGKNLFIIEATNSVNLSSSITIHIFLDTTPPMITFINPSTDLNVNKQIFLISCFIEEKGSQVDSIHINNNIVTLNEDNIAEMLITLKEGNNFIEVKATDKVRNTNIVTRYIFLDLQPPIIDILSKWNPEEVLFISNYELYFRVNDIGTGVESVLLADQIGKVTNLQLNHDEYRSSLLLMKGNNLFTITAIDNAGNETKQTIQLQYQPAEVITLTIGNSIATVQKNLEIKEVVMQAPPVITKGTTFVPIRFIAEAFGAKVGWIGHPTNEIQIEYKGTLIHLWIGKSFGVVEKGIETKKIALASPPYITKGTTMVPVRFIADGMGAETKWDGAKQEITIILAEE